MTDIETSKPLDKALNFNSENIFEYIEFLTFHVNADLHGQQASETAQNLCKYIEELPLPDPNDVMMDVESMVNEAMTQTSEYAYKAGFMEACRLMRTLQSF